MAKKKSDKPEESDAQQELERRVDAIMNPEGQMPTIDYATHKSAPKPETQAPEPEVAPELPIVIALAEEADEPAPAAKRQNQAKDLLEEDATDKAVDEIVASDSDALLELNGPAAHNQQGSSPGSHQLLFWLGLATLLAVALSGLFFARS